MAGNGTNFIYQCPTDYECSGGTLLLPFVNESTFPKGGRIVMYLLALIWMFLGVAIGADLFMCAIEVITSKTKIIRVGKGGDDDPEDKGYEEIQVRFWNDTVANLTLMALGSSAPEILLSIIEIVGNKFEAGKLGPGTIVGSAAFNLFVIIAICVMAIPSGESKQINAFGVFLITSFFAVFAYIWLFLVLSVISPDVIELWEAIITLLLFPLLVILAYMADKEMCAKIFNRKGSGDDIELENLNLLDEKVLQKTHPDLIEYMKQITANPHITEDEAAKLIAIKIEQSKRKNYGYYRVGSLRFLTGGKKMVPRVQSKLQGMLEGTAVANVAIVDAGADSKSKRSKVEFAATSISLLESAKKAELILTRTMDLSQTVAVQYNTVDGTATAGQDYVAAKGEVVFKPDVTQETIEIELIDDHEWEPDETFFVKLYTQPNDTKVIVGEHCIAEVTLINDDTPGTFQFTKPSHIIKESVGKVQIEVERIDGADGKVEVTWKTTDQSAVHGKDYMGGEQVLTFDTAERTKNIEIEIIDDHQFEKDETFMVELAEVNCEGAKLGRLRRTVVTIVSDDEYKRMFDRVVGMANLNLDKLAWGQQTWGQQFTEAMSINGGDIDGASTMDYVMHFLSFFWKVLFAFVPPCSWLGGWLSFAVILAMIGIMTALIGDLATVFGCLIGLRDEVTAITFVALGTSLPDLFASKAAANNEKYADASIGNVTGSNGVNVFLGLGIPWVIAASYHAYKQTPGGFASPAGTLATSVILYSICAAAVISLIIIRRFVGAFGKGALGGPSCTKYACGAFMIGLWFLYVLISALVAYGHLSPIKV